MAWTSMHFAVGMACSGAATVIGCAILRKGWRWLPPIMTLGGFWAIVPDMPRLWREDFPSLPFAATLGRKSLESTLHQWGDWFFFHRYFDTHREEHQYGLHGLILMILFYNMGIGLLLWMEHRQRNSPANKAWKAHGSQRNGAAKSVVLDPVHPHRTRSSHLSRGHDEELIEQLVHRDSTAPPVHLTGK